MSNTESRWNLSSEEDSLAFMFGHDLPQTWSTCDGPSIRPPNSDPIQYAESWQHATMSSLGARPDEHEPNASSRTDFGQHSQSWQEEGVVNPLLSGWWPAAFETGQSDDPSVLRSVSALAQPDIAPSDHDCMTPWETYWSPTSHSVSSTGVPLPSYQPVSSSDAASLTETRESEMLRWGHRVNGLWRCRFPRCRSKQPFNRPCDLRKHYKSHLKTHYCRKDSQCPHAVAGAGFSTSKDRARHEAKHNPQISCDDEECSRLFSRTDNMRDHFRRRHAANERADEATK